MRVLVFPLYSTFFVLCIFSVVFFVDGVGDAWCLGLILLGQILDARCV